MQGDNNNGQSIGIDAGIKVFAYLSTEKSTKHIDIKKEISNVIKVQKVLSRKRKGSKNRIKSKIRLAKKHLKLRNK